MAATDNYEMAVDLDPGADEMVVDDVPRDDTDRLKSNATKRKGRGFSERRAGGVDNDEFTSGRFESLEDTATGQAQRSVEGWIVLITGVHEEANEEDVSEKCAEYGEIKNLHLNLDRRTGYVKGYALVEYETFKEAKAAIDGLNGSTLLDQVIKADFAFVRGASASTSVQERDTRRHRRGGDRRDERRR
ncbi:uncharacterized protein SPPG_02323 [Spizellomyces punctatus DAOM BR117]|uniref:RNA-binding protein 8A n=1 Tax=Spizellomyces punctatus (strain DAOM BR117) TaxID=645134 RepID=A0A0L0HQD6_SPIPD|nr:uncharacterized protein SPPG_02323 [Spizellomyces punctatus DAOM BR117]KND03273.1 hypothetical protein SPPG_02323 [Spizellomyces punctatus DAOM BR117]|eukprot:XP_016611312.1 hypothetical protein SPPG_02323 [Spizellomyces punctatus DAOM BR117]